MPKSVVTHFMKKTGLPEPKVEKYWDKAVEIVKDQYDFDDEDERFYKLVVGVMKKMLKNKMKESTFQRAVAEVLGENFDALRAFFEACSYCENVKSHLMNIVTGEKGISEKDFNGIDDVKVKLDEFWKENCDKLHEITDDFEKKGYRHEYCAEYIRATTVGDIFV